MVRTTTDDYERLVSAITALKVQESTFFDDPPRYYSKQGVDSFVEVIHRLEHLTNGGANASHAEAVS